MPTSWGSDVAAVGFGPAGIEWHFHANRDWNGALRRAWHQWGLAIASTLKREDVD